MKRTYPVIIVGGGQAGLSAAYFLRRQKIEFLILDANTEPGGSWQHTWPSLKLFSPADYSSLSGWRLPTTENEYPTKDEFIDYLEKYEARYEFPVQRQTTVTAIEQDAEGVYLLRTNQGEFRAAAVVIATGTASGAYIPHYPGVEQFKGEQLHSVKYDGYDRFLGKKVLVVGAGNTGAQIFAELVEHTDAVWTSNKLPEYLPDHLDGRYLFSDATKKYIASKNGQPVSGSKSEFGNIVMVEPVKRARDKNLLHARVADFMFYEDGVIWGDDNKEAFDAVIWATGFKPDLNMLVPLGIVDDGKVRTDETRVLDQDGLWIVGLGDWTGYASATIYGVGKTARDAASQIASYLQTTEAPSSTAEATS